MVNFQLLTFIIKTPYIVVIFFIASHSFVVRQCFHIRRIVRMEHMMMRFFAEKLRQLGKSRAGLSLVEYALVGALVSVAAIATLTTLGEEISGTVENLGTAMSNAKAKVPTS